jgi:hypothetical protein
MLQHYNNTNGLCVNTNIYWIVVMVIQMHFFDKVEIMYQAI